MYSGYVHTHKNNVMQRGANTPHSSPLVACSLLFLFFLYKIQKSKCHNFSVDTSSKSTPSYTHLNSMSKLLINIFFLSDAFIYIHTCCLYACPNTHGCLKNSHECIKKPFRQVLVLPYNFVRLHRVAAFVIMSQLLFHVMFLLLCVCVCVYWQLWTVF